MNIQQLHKLYPDLKKAYKDNDWETYYKLLIQYKRKHAKTNKR